MSDDIDIEEHDILDNPHIRKIFPDLSVVKKEISEFLNEAINIKQEPEPSQSTPKHQTEIINTSSNNNEILSVINDNNEILSVINDKNSLSPSPLAATKNTLEFKQYQTNITFKKNKIIIGSKPSKCTTPKATEDKSSNKLISFPKVILRDCKSYLENNKRYCKNCQILFSASGQLCEHKRKRDVASENRSSKAGPKEGFNCRLCHVNISSKSNLTRHYKNVHKKILTFKSVNQMVKIETTSKLKVKNYRSKTQSTYCCKVCKSTFNSLSTLKRHNRNVHLSGRIKELSSKSEVDGEVRNTRANKSDNSDTTCFHCKKIFPDHKSLIEHVYEILEPKNSKNTEEQSLSKEKEKSKTGNVTLSKNVSQDLCQTKNKKSSKLPTNNFKSKIKNKETIASSSKNIAKMKTRSKRQDKTATKTKEQRKESQNQHPSDRKVELRPRIKNVNRTAEHDENRLEASLNEISHNTSLHSKNIKKSSEISKKTEKENKHVYVCPHCSYCFLIAKNYIKHIKIKHDAKVPKLAKTLFDPQCNYCQGRNVNIVLHNRHLYKKHPNELVKKVNQERKVTTRLAKVKSKNYLTAFAFKSVLFKCIRCDIHFISAEAAKDHDGHMEILINWKCHICDLIFKRNDKKVHLEQHSFTNNLTVEVLDSKGLSSLLYNCTKCAIHFSEKSYLEHYQTCETKTAASVYCKFCDILINETDLMAHKTVHNNVDDFYLNVVTSDIIFFEELEGETEQQKLFMDNGNTETTKKVLNETLVYCPTCKCYMTHVRKIHYNRLCAQLIKHVCDICGIVMTNKCIDTHRKYHKTKDFNLYDLSFLDMHGNTITPPFPAYPQCNICNVYFTSKVDIIGHVCNDTQYVTCEVCQNNLSDAAYKLHMPYHDYKVQKNKKIAVKIPKSNKTASNKTSSELNKANVASVKPDNALILNKSNDTFTPTKSLTMNSISPKRKEELHESTVRRSKTQNTGMGDAQNESTDDIDFVMIFSCKNCFVALDKYDKVVEHCQNHITSKKSPSSDLMFCSICKLKFDTTIESHKHVHDPQKPIKKFTFDVKYFSFDNNVWVNHVFQSLSGKVISQIIGKSIYKDEHRVRFQIIQPGPSHLTVHKCAVCKNIITTESIFKHTGCKDSSIRNIPCSKCGLTFMSRVSCNQHQLIHKQYPDLNLNSYNILLFNQKSKQHGNSKLTFPNQYILYLCRNCNGIIEKSDEEHKCEINDLKKCSECGLLIYEKEFNNHITQHRSSPNFCTKNMKVILTGIRNETEVIDSKTLTSSFNGLIYDYTLYQCNHCKICVKNDQLIAKHVCILGIFRFKCHKCDFYFTEKAFKPHLKSHSIDLDFKKDNINIVQFDLKCVLGNTTDTNVNDQVENKSDDSEEQDKNETENSVGTTDNNEPNHDATNAVTLYKCKCELHFIDKLNAKQHSEKCSLNQRSSKQICTKCNLLFNPNELFTHLLTHHSDKSLNYKPNIVEITDKNLDSLDNINLYKCSKCTLHFSSKHVADSHFLLCEGVMKDSEECKKCNTAFDKTSFNYEEHSIICDKEYHIVLIDETNFKISSNLTETPTT